MDTVIIQAWYYLVGFLLIDWALVVVDVVIRLLKSN